MIRYRFRIEGTSAGLFVPVAAYVMGVGLLVFGLISHLQQGHAPNPGVASYVPPPGTVISYEMPARLLSKYRQPPPVESRLEEPRPAEPATTTERPASPATARSTNVVENRPAKPRKPPKRTAPARERGNPLNDYAAAVKRHPELPPLRHEELPPPWGS
jgi:hypothetical protein